MTQPLPRPRRQLPPVSVHPMTIGLPPGTEPSEWFACCTRTVWIEAAQEQSNRCNWYGESRGSEREARADAQRHRRAHVSLYRPGVGDPA